MQKTENLLVAVNNLVNNDGEFIKHENPDIEDLLMRSSDLASFAVRQTTGELRDILLSVAKAGADLAEWANINWEQED